MAKIDTKIKGTMAVKAKQITGNIRNNSRFACILIENNNASLSGAASAEQYATICNKTDQKMGVSIKEKGKIKNNIFIFDIFC